MSSFEQTKKNQMKAKARLNKVADLSNANVKLAFHLREAAKLIGQEDTGMTNGQVEAYKCLARV
ncbi:MAG: hypothetical protein ABJN42_21655 [Roseibium sp.]|uniref:hypothetical protein n=1 Tax=Roseibium sp. TaxID=1936156 RepID=UPI00329A5CC9